VILRDHLGNVPPQSKRLIRLIEKVTNAAREQGLKVKHYEREDVRCFFEQFEVKTKYEIAQAIIRWFPELKGREPKVRKLYMNENHNMGAFDAVALALTHFYMTE